jgi:hypothetical protein
MTRKDQVVTKIGVTFFAKLTIPTRYRRIDCHPLPVFCYAGKLVTQHQGMTELGVANPGFGKPVQIGAAYTDRGHTH